MISSSFVISHTIASSWVLLFDLNSAAPLVVKHPVYYFSWEKVEGVERKWDRRANLRKPSCLVYPVVVLVHVQVLYYV
jgi:hypothetical protein